MHDVVVRDLEAARDRTLGLTDLGEPTLVAQHGPLMSPLVRDLAHVGQQEELWLLLGGDSGPAAAEPDGTPCTTRRASAGRAASEPYDDDPGWVVVPDHHLVDVTDGVVTIADLEA